MPSTKTLEDPEPVIWKNLYAIGGIAALIQLVSILAYSIILAVLGPGPSTVEEYFAMFQSAPMAAMFRGDFLLLFLIGGYFGTFPALYLALRKINPAAAMFATLFTFVAVTVCFATESTFALRHLAGQYAVAITDIQCSQLLAAGEAVIASDMWHSSGAYVSGILMQGGGIIISLVMLRSREFSKVTAIAGLLGNAFDLAQHLLHPFAPSISAPIQMLMGPFYLVWFPMLARDFFRLAKKG